jgi:23S rRNA (uridine2552-2'-O)-methyltransferase
MPSKNRFSKAWMHEHLTDPYVRLAQKHGYRSRAAFKLREIDDVERLIRPGLTVVDLGSAPGSWSQVLRERMLGPDGKLSGRIVALDLLPMEPVPDVEFLLGDFRDDAVGDALDQLIGPVAVDLVVSDMAPNLSGVAMADAARVSHVVELAVEFAVRRLKPPGVLVVKCFHGSGYSQLVELFKDTFSVVAPRKPKASRDKSSETFLVGRRLKRAV